MRNRGRGRKGGRPVTGIGGLVADAAHTIVSIVNDGSDHMLITFAGNHGLTAGATFIAIDGTSLLIYNSRHTIDETPTPTTAISYDAYLGDSTGGIWH